MVIFISRRRKETCEGVTMAIWWSVSVCRMRARLVLHMIIVPRIITLVHNLFRRCEVWDTIP